MGADPEVGGEMHILCSDVGVEASLSRFHAASGPVVSTLPERETLIVLEGGARIEIADGPTLELRAGRYRVAAGWRTAHLAPEPAFQGVLGDTALMLSDGEPYSSLPSAGDS